MLTIILLRVGEKERQQRKKDQKKGKVEKVRRKG
jgi:hypothetical protein